MARVPPPETDNIYEDRWLIAVLVTQLVRLSTEAPQRHYMRSPHAAAGWLQNPPFSGSQNRTCTPRRRQSNGKPARVVVRGRASGARLASPQAERGALACRLFGRLTNSLPGLAQFLGASRVVRQEAIRVSGMDAAAVLCAPRSRHKRWTMSAELGSPARRLAICRTRGSHTVQREVCRFKTCHNLHVQGPVLRPPP